ncbi:flagellar protein FlgN [Pectinatus sottacetonis]|uniref:flagellar protein FlgN n=1 Tax=Pectinatus sottacetonis TaxID=1002795 RepID=UPI0018C56D8C|nr:flagellar protein FlgN [Pectinatus sottacetonis]
MWQDLIDIIIKLTMVYTDILKSNERKRKAVLAIDMKTLDQIINEEQKLMAIVIKEEQKRQEILKKMADKNPSINLTSNVKSLTFFCPTDYKDKFLAVNKDLSEIVKKVADINEANKMLMQGALTAVNLNLNSLVQMKADPDYKKNGSQYFSPQEKKLDFKA